MGFRDFLFYVFGLGFLSLAKAKNVLQGYTTPKPFSFSDIERCVDYDITVVEHWLSWLRNYTNNSYSIADKNVLELGPGSDLGVGIYLLAKGCLKYNACDVNDLMKSTPGEFYQTLFDKIKTIDNQLDIAPLKEELEKTKAGTPSRLNYVVRDDFDLVFSFGASTIDLVFSQAAFEHFENVEKIISQLGEACKPGAILIAEIDLKTHSRWIRDKDPNNIYRYPTWIYNIFRFRGIPSRLRPFQYKAAFERFGWTNILIFPLREISDQNDCYSGMHRIFSDKINQMNYLSIMICAKKSDRGKP